MIFVWVGWVDRLRITVGYTDCICLFVCLFYSIMYSGFFVYFLALASCRRHGDDCYDTTDMFMMTAVNVYVFSVLVSRTAMGGLLILSVIRLGDGLMFWLELRLVHSLNPISFVTMLV